MKPRGHQLILVSVLLCLLAACGFSAPAKSRLTEVIEKAQCQGPQTIAQNGKNVVVVVDAGTWERSQQDRRGSFTDFLTNSPLRASGLKVSRLKSSLRKIDL